MRYSKMNMNDSMKKFASLFEVKWTRSLPVVTPIQIEHKLLRDEEAHWVFEMAYYTVVMGVVLACMLMVGGLY